MQRTHLPPAGSFLWGAATASFQIEGANRADGRGRSIWDTLCEVPGAIKDGSDGSRACDSYHRYEEDLALVDGLGVGWYRFSIAWPRIVPQGTGSVEPRGLDYYDRLVDGLLERDLAPMATLYHWDLPQPLEDDGGWLERVTAEAFADYASVVHNRLGDRVGVWATHNEPWCAAFLGYGSGVHAPGRAEGVMAHRAAHNLMLGHAWAADRLRDAGARDVGVVLNLAPFEAEGPEADMVTREAAALRNGIWLDPLVDGGYGEDLLRVAPVLQDADVVREGDLEAIHNSADWIGINYYTPMRTDVLRPGEEPHPEAKAYPGVENLTFRPRPPLTDIGWEIEPSGLQAVLEQTSQRTNLPIVITENGAACADDDLVDGAVRDDDRIAYLHSHLDAVRAAQANGADVRGYIVWTLLDNFEWAEGYTKTFGIVHVDPDTADRTPKASYSWFAAYVDRYGEDFNAV